MILKLEKNKVYAMAENGMTVTFNLSNRNDSETIIAICKALKEGKTQEKIAELFNLSDDREVRRVKSQHCQDCGNTK